MKIQPCLVKSVPYVGIQSLSTKFCPWILVRQSNHEQQIMPVLDVRQFDFLLAKLSLACKTG